MNNKEQILDLFYNQNLKQCEIVKQLNLSKQYVSKIVRADKRYAEVKEFRKQKNAKKRKIYMKNYFKDYERPKKQDDSYIELMALLEQDARELSYSNNTISDYAFAKWNPNAYHTNKKGNLVLNKGLKVGSDVPKSINMNIKVPTQKYKNKYCYSR